MDDGSRIKKIGLCQNDVSYLFMNSFPTDKKHIRNCFSLSSCVMPL